MEHGVQGLGFWGSSFVCVDHVMILSFDPLRPLSVQHTVNTQP